MHLAFHPADAPDPDIQFVVAPERSTGTWRPIFTVNSTKRSLAAASVDAA